MNEPIPLSSFGIFTNECSQLFCKDKDGLELWLSFVNECNNNSSYNNQMLIQNNYKLHSPLFVGLVCSLIGILCFQISYVFFRCIHIHYNRNLNDKNLKN